MVAFQSDTFRYPENLLSFTGAELSPRGLVHREEQVCENQAQDKCSGAVNPVRGISPSPSQRGMLQGREFLPLQAGGDIFSQEAFLYSKKKKKKKSHPALRMDDIYHLKGGFSLPGIRETIGRFLMPVLFKEARVHIH